MNRSGVSSLTEFILQSERSFRLAEAVHDSFPKVRDQVIEGFCQRLGQRLQKNLKGWKSEYFGPFFIERYGAFELRGRFADAGKDDVRGLKAGLSRELDLPNGIGVGRAAEIAHQARDRERGVGLQRVMQRVRVVAERGVDGAIARPERGGAIDIDRCPLRLRNG